MECKCLDSDILIDFLRGKEKAVKYIESVRGSSRIVTTVINVFELYYGALKYNKDVEKLDEFLQSVEILPFTVSEAKKAAEIEVDLENRGEVIGLKDVLISSIALNNNCTIVTGNVKHFERIQGVKVENWK
ncbi:type II toxin-antitoxin system VapC family toxin [Sulfurisphaera tokodaii]|uniref:Ribonuclease n=2 Tax=Sulfurisphaera tokodaii TaxID=111955 RepID=F9VNP7_SULTO|nr:type II toxin-antitoxin system VapC family toxin [Sulfurisphaera tokodaii]BAK54693.1 putative ribonuclease [Sulfurisphaera tokodaii str. 7]HII74477.1 type II toxin-antitoxin system VapC family toxin [Sulfurisphaera tokodaii]